MPDRTSLNMETKPTLAFTSLSVLMMLALMIAWPSPARGQAGQRRSAQVVVDVTAREAGFATKLQLSAEGGFLSLLLESDPLDPASNRLVLRALKGQLDIAPESFKLALASGAPGDLKVQPARFVVNGDGRLESIVIPYTVSLRDRGIEKSLELNIRLVMEMAYALYQPVQLAVQNVQSAVSGADRVFRFDLRFDATASERALRWSFLRMELYTASGKVVSGPQYAEVFTEVQNKNTVRTRQGVEVTASGAAQSNEALVLRALAVGQDADGLLILQNLEFNLP